MTVHTFCDRCGLEYTGPGVTIGQNIYCCAGCASGGPCTCTPVSDGTLIPAGPGAFIAGDDDVVIVDR